MRCLIMALASGHWPSLVGAWLHFEVSFMAWLLIGALGVLIAQEFDLTATQKGVLVAVPLLGGALLRVPVGWASDRFGPKRIGLLVLGAQLLAVVWGWRGATEYRSLLGVGLCLGSAGASFAVALPLASRVYPPAHQGLVMGVAASANSGTVLAMLLAPRLGVMFGWHAVFGLLLIPIAVTMLAFALLVRADAPPPAATAALRHRPASHGIGSVSWLSFLYAVTFGGFVGYCSVLPIFLHDHYGLDVVTAGTVTALCGLAGSLIRPLGGYVADRSGGLQVLRVVLPMLFVLTAGIGQLPPRVVAVPLIVSAVAVMGFGNGVVFQVVSDWFGRRIGFVTGVVGAAGGLGGFLFPFWLGLLKDVTGSYRAGFWLFAVTAAVAGATTMFRRRWSVPVPAD